MNMERRAKVQKIKRLLSVGVTAVMLALLGVSPAFAASAISSVNITLDLDIEAGEPLPSLNCGYTGDDCEVAVSSNSRYDISSAKWVKEPDEATLGTSYSLKIYIEAINDYEFNGTYSSRNVKVKGGELVSVKRESRRELLVTAKSRPAEGEFDIPDDAQWTDAGSKSKLGQAKWNRVDNAAYEVYLYRGGKVVEKLTGITGTSYNLYPYMTVKGTYSFRVRAVAKDEETEKYAKSSDWSYSDEIYIGEDEVSDGSGRISSDGTAVTPLPPSDTSQVGWLESNKYWYYRYPDGSYLTDCWANIGNQWYLFDANGAMMTGWQTRNGYTYYLKDSGEMQTGWLSYEGRWYYLNPRTDFGTNGAMMTGWLGVGGTDYYMKADGSMAEGWQEVDGSWYYFYPGSGAKAFNTYIDGFYVDQNGIWKKPEVQGA